VQAHDALSLNTVLWLQNNSLDLVERDLIVPAVVELGGTRAFVRRHLLGVLEEAAIEQIDGYAGVRSRPAARQRALRARATFNRSSH